MISMSKSGDSNIRASSRTRESDCATLEDFYLSTSKGDARARTYARRATMTYC
jgi:hypothetical protein